MKILAFEKKAWNGAYKIDSAEFLTKNKRTEERIQDIFFLRSGHGHAYGKVVVNINSWTYIFQLFSKSKIETLPDADPLTWTFFGSSGGVNVGAGWCSSTMFTCLQ